MPVSSISIQCIQTHIPTPFSLACATIRCRSNPLRGSSRTLGPWFGRLAKPYHPPSIVWYGHPISDAKSTRSIVSPVERELFDSTHQSHVLAPGFTNEKSIEGSGGGFRFAIMSFLRRRSTSSSPTIATRQGLTAGASAITAVSAVAAGLGGIFEREATRRASPSAGAAR